MSWPLVNGPHAFYHQAQHRSEVLILIIILLQHFCPAVFRGHLSIYQCVSVYCDVSLINCLTLFSMLAVVASSAEARSLCLNWEDNHDVKDQKI